MKRSMILLLGTALAVIACASTNPRFPSAKIETIQEVAWRMHWETLLYEIYTFDTRPAGADSVLAKQVDFFQQLTGVTSDSETLLGVVATPHLVDVALPAWNEWHIMHKDSLEVVLAECPIVRMPASVPERQVDLKAAWKAHRQALLTAIKVDGPQALAADSSGALQIAFFEELTGIMSNIEGLQGSALRDRLVKVVLPAWEEWFRKNRGDLEVALVECPVILRQEGATEELVPETRDGM